MARGDELIGCERCGVSQVSVESEKERGPLLDDTNPRMGVTVDATFVALGGSEEALQVEIVGRQVVVALDEKAGSEAIHHAGHVQVDGG